MLALAVIAAGMAIPSFSVAAQSTTQDEVMVVSLRNGHKDVVKLADTPKVTFEQEKCLVVSSNANFEYDMADIEFVTFQNSVAAEALPDQKLSIDFSNPAQITVAGAEPESTVAVFNLSGSSVASATADNLGTAVVEISGLAPAPYILTIEGGHALKFIKK